MLLCILSLKSAPLTNLNKIKTFWQNNHTVLLRIVIFYALFVSLTALGPQGLRFLHPIRLKWFGLNLKPFFLLAEAVLSVLICQLDADPTPLQSEHIFKLEVTNSMHIYNELHSSARLCKSFQLLVIVSLACTFIALRVIFLLCHWLSHPLAGGWGSQVVVIWCVPSMEQKGVMQQACCELLGTQEMHLGANEGRFFMLFVLCNLIQFCEHSSFFR